jgi:hypothetical protein
MAAKKALEIEYNYTFGSSLIPRISFSTKAIRFHYWMNY